MVPQMVLINLPPGAPRLDPDLGTPADPLSYLLCSLEEGQAGDSSFPLSQQRGTEDNKARFTVDSVGGCHFPAVLAFCMYWVQDLCPGLLVPWG